MPKRNRRSNRNRARRAPRNNVVGYVKPNFRRMDAPQSQSITLHGNFGITSGVLGTNGGILNVNWNFFNDAAALALVYKYFEIEGIQLRFSLATTVAAQDSFIAAAIAFFPINYITEGIITAVPTQRNQVQDLPGSIFVEYGTKNNGRWFYPGIKQQFACSDAFSTSLNRIAGAIVWYVEDIGVSETLGAVDLSINLKFYQREYASNPSLAQVGLGRDLCKYGNIISNSQPSKSIPEANLAEDHFDESIIEEESQRRVTSIPEGYTVAYIKKK